MTIAKNYQLINQTFNELSSLLVEKLHNCYVEKEITDSFIDLIQAVNDIPANEVTNENNIMPSNMPSFDTTNIATFNISLYKRIRYYMKLLGYYLVLKGVPIKDVNRETDLKGLIKLIDMIHAIKPTFLTLGNVDELQYYGTDIRVPYTLKDIDNINVSEGDITIKDSNGIIYNSIQVGDFILITPINTTKNDNDEYGYETFTITYSGTENYLPSESQTITVKILPAQIRLNLTATNVNVESPYYNNTKRGCENDEWHIEIQTLNYHNQPLSNIHFNLNISDIFFLENEETNENGIYSFNQTFAKPDNYTIFCETIYENPENIDEREKMLNANVEYEIEIKYNVMQQLNNFYTDYAGKETYTYNINIVNEETGEPDNKYDGYIIKIFDGDMQVDTVTINEDTASYTLHRLSEGKKTIQWVIDESNLYTKSYTHINILSNFILPTKQIFYLNDTPEVFYIPDGVKNNNIIICDCSYTNMDGVTVKQEVTLTTDLDGKINELSSYKDVGDYTLTLKTNSPIDETVVFKYSIQKPFDIILESYNKKTGIVYNIVLHDENEYELSVIKNGESVNPLLYNISQDDNIITFSMLANDNFGQNTLSITTNEYTESVDFEFFDKVFNLLTSSVELGLNTIGIECSDNSIENIYIESDDINIINIEKENNIFMITGYFYKAGLINFKVVDEDSSFETFNIQVNKVDLSNNINTALYYDDNENQIPYGEQNRAAFTFSISDIELYSDFYINFLVYNDTNELVYNSQFTYGRFEYEASQLRINSLLPGNYQAIFSFNGDNNYESFSETINFAIIKSTPDITFNIYSAYDKTLYDPSDNNHHTTLVTDENADLIFKEGNYVNTYLVVEAEGTPDGEIFHLVNENGDYLYSPFDTNRNQIKTQCNIIIGETNIIPLPANYTSEEIWTDFEADIYNWKIKYDENDFYETYEESFDIEIRNFDVAKCDDIFPNEDLIIQLKTYIDTINEDEPHIGDIPHDGASYNPITGELILPNVDKNIGEHTLIFDGYTCTYNVKNPIEFYKETESQYAVSTYNIYIGCKALTGQMFEDEQDKFSNIESIEINGEYLSKTAPSVGGENNAYVAKLISNKPPGTYYCKVIAHTTNCPGNYIATGISKITTEKCSITLSFDDETNNLVATYLYNGVTPIPNAIIQIKQENDTVVQTGTTNSNGQFSIQVLDGLYYAEVLDNYTNEVLLTSESSGNEFYLQNVSVKINDNGTLIDMEELDTIIYREGSGNIYGYTIEIEDIANLRHWRVLFL